MSQISEQIIIGVMTSCAIGFLAFFVKGYFTELKSAIAKLDGSLEVMRRDLHDTREEMIKAQSELKALWRVADNLPKRASDRG